MNKISVLFVCLGNICRSPAAEAIFIRLIEKNGLTDALLLILLELGVGILEKKLTLG